VLCTFLKGNRTVSEMLTTMGMERVGSELGEMRRWCGCGADKIGSK
jgi:hypothetical protein